MVEKTTLLNEFTAERDSRQDMLNKTNEAIATAEGAKAAAESELEDEQTYLAQVKKSCEDAKHLYEMRREDPRRRPWRSGRQRRCSLRRRAGPPSCRSPRS